MLERIQRILAAVFEKHPSEIDDNFTPETEVNWDSLRHINMIVALEEEFEISFDETEIPEMLSISIIYSTIQKKVDEN